MAECKYCHWPYKVMLGDKRINNNVGYYMAEHYSSEVRRTWVKIYNCPMCNRKLGD